MAKEKAVPVCYSAVRVPPRQKLVCKTPSLTRQSEAASADINVIVKRFQSSGMVSLNSRPGLFLDVSEMGDYREALEQVRQADEFFMALPSATRARFRNDAAEFLDFVSDPANRSEMEQLGLLGPVPEKEPENAVKASSGS